MRTAFDPEVRVLACDQCGAPLEGAVGAIDLTCKYCEAHNQVALPTKVPRGQPLSPEEQMRRLHEQMGRPLVMSPAVADFMDGSQLASWREREALAAWVEARQRIRAQDADHATETRFFELTRLLADAASQAGDGLRERALLESGYEVSPLPRHRTTFAGRLAQRAALAGDLQSAEAWIERCDAGVDDLEAFSTLAIARALLAHRRNDSQGALTAMGEAGAPVPLMADDQPLGAVLRADALEQLGRVDEGVDTLERVTIAGWPRARAAIPLARDAVGEQPCPQAVAAFVERRGRVGLANWWSGLIVLVVFILLWGGGAVAGLVYGLRGNPGAFVALAAVIPAGVLIWGLIAILQSRDAWRKPSWATVREVHPAASRSKAKADLVLDESPGEVVTVSFEAGDVVEKGMRALLCGRSWLD